MLDTFTEKFLTVLDNLSDHWVLFALFAGAFTILALTILWFILTVFVFMFSMTPLGFTGAILVVSALYVAYIFKKYSK
jgi:hypothetical protein